MHVSILQSDRSLGVRTGICDIIILFAAVDKVNDIPSIIAHARAIDWFDFNCVVKIYLVYVSVLRTVVSFNNLCLVLHARLIIVMVIDYCQIAYPFISIEWFMVWCLFIFRDIPRYVTSILIFPRIRILHLCIHPVSSHEWPVPCDTVIQTRKPQHCSTEKRHSPHQRVATILPVRT